MDSYFFDVNRVRFKLEKTGEGKPYNWLFFPGGPGADSSYLAGLIDLLDLPGNLWLVDLPGNGGNQEGEEEADFDKWEEIFLEAVGRFSNPVLVGHSFGGMFPLLFPQLEKQVKGLVILGSSPALWHEEAAACAKRFSLPDITEAMGEFTRTPSESTFKKAIDLCMPYYFPEKTIEKGREMFSSVRFHYPASVWWQKRAAELNFSAKWVPDKVPTIILGGSHDHITPQVLFQRDLRFSRPNIHHCIIEGAGHCCWVEEPRIVREKFENFARQLA